MKAETAYNVIQALNKEERERLHKMLLAENKKVKTKKTRIWSEVEVMEKLILMFQKRSAKESKD